MNSIPLLSCNKKSFCRPQFLVSFQICHRKMIVVGDVAWEFQHQGVQFLFFPIF